jgi:hypothetical protein
MPVAVLARRIEFDPVLMGVLDRGHAQAAGLERGDEPLDQRGLAAPLMPDDRDDTHPNPMTN